MRIGHRTWRRAFGVVFFATAIVGCAADSEDSDSGSEGALAQGDARTVVHIGDSISVGEFGSQIQKDYASAPSLANVSFYAACGSRPRDWLQANHTKHAQTACGYMERHPDGTHVDDPYQPTGTPPHDIPYIEAILASTRPTLVVVQLGLNMMGDPSADGSLDTQPLAAEAARLKAAILGGAPAGSRLCVWIAPNVAPRWSPHAQDAFFAMLQSTVGKECLVIDGRPVTRREDVGPDGVHVYGAGARHFADAAFDQIRAYVASHGAG